uniref:Uncharacterized protein n=1 Tax=Triticum urartu TaxID=4572 RepID=A0A8R7P8W4_TRIUA
CIQDSRIASASTGYFSDGQRDSGDNLGLNLLTLQPLRLLMLPGFTMSTGAIIFEHIIKLG